MEKQLNFEIRHDHSLDDQKKLPPATARCANENQNYTSECGQCPPAFRYLLENCYTMQTADRMKFQPTNLKRKGPQCLTLVGTVTNNQVI